MMIMGSFIDRMKELCPTVYIKNYQFFPTARTLIPRYITLDTKILVKFISGTNKYKSMYSENISLFQEEIWRECFPQIHRYIKPTAKYTFDYKISTDGFAISLQMILNSEENQLTPKLKDTPILYSSLMDCLHQKVRFFCVFLFLK